MENLPRSGLAAPGEVCFSFLERGGEFESSRLPKTAKTAVFASLVRYFYFTPSNSSIPSQLFLFLSKPCSLCTKIPHQSAGFLLASRLSTKLGRSVIIGFQESQSYQRFAGRQQEVLSIIIKKQKANLNILPYLVRSSVLLLRHNS